MNSIFQGLSAFPLTPAGPDGRVDVAALGALLERLVDAGVDSIGLLGSTGIYAYLEPAERRRAVAAAVEAVAGRTPLIVGVGALRTDWTVELARDAERQGADALLVAPVSYTPPTEDEVFAHYEAVAGATALPVCLYNNPATTHVQLSRPFLGRLSGLASLAAVKMPAPKDGGFREELEALRAVAPPGFAVGYSGDPATVPALLAGADGFFSGIAGVLPVPMLALARAARAGDTETAARLNSAFEPLWGFCRTHGALRVAYAISRLLGLGAGEPPRPLLPLAAEVQDGIAGAIGQLPGVRG
ncbi:MAG: dapA [Caulobacter sp.]|nr:dapA [Caulobacter sp.]